MRPACACACGAVPVVRVAGGGDSTATREVGKLKGRLRVTEEARKKGSSAPLDLADLFEQARDHPKAAT